MAKKSTHIVYGLATAVVMAIVDICIIYAGLPFFSFMARLIYIPMLAGIILNGMAFSKANGGYVKFGEVFMSCFKAVAIITAVRLILIPVSNLLFPHMNEKAFALIQDRMAGNPRMQQDKIGEVMNVIRMLWGFIVALVDIFATLFYGAIFSVIGGAIAKKKLKPETIG